MKPLGTKRRGIGLCTRAAGLALFALAAAGAAAQPNMPPTPVVVAPVEERDLPASIALVGTVLPLRSALIASEVSGILVELQAVEGLAVRRGDVLARLDASALQLRVAEARARLEQLRADLQLLENGTRVEELERLSASVAEAQAVVERWRFERDRLEGMSEQSSAPKERHDAAMELLAAERRLSQEQARLLLARNGARAEELLAARAALAAQEAVVKRLERDEALTQIRAPFDGVVVMRRTELGQWIEIGGPVCELIAIESVKIRTDVPESAIHFATVGAPASVVIEAIGESRSATIARVVPLASAAARTFPVEIDLPNPERRFLPGMFVRTHIPSGPRGRKLLVPKDAIVPQGLNRQIWVVRDGPDGTPMTAPLQVTTGMETESLIEVFADGLKAGDRVVVRANERLFMPGPVAPTPFDGASASRPSGAAAAGAAP